MEDRKLLCKLLQNCVHPVEVEKHITTKLVNIYTGEVVSENVNATQPVDIGIQQMFQRSLLEWFHERLLSKVITM